MYRTTILMFLVIFSSIAFADTVVLQEGQRLRGEILAEKEAAVILDIGYTALTIPRERIAEILRDDTEETVSDANQTVPEQQDFVELGKLYHATDRRKMSIEDCVDLVSESVVMVKTPSGSGSGFFINDEGYLITNYHVIERETRISVTIFQKSSEGFNKHKFKKVKIEALNPFIDLALLKVEDLEGKEIHSAAMGNMDDLKVGEPVFAIGNPLGLERTVTDGLVSSVNRAFEGLVYVQTNTDINPGNSGGPLFNLSGEVVGVTNMGYIFYGGLGFAIPINYVKHFIDNRDAFAYDKDNPNTGYRYVQPGPRTNPDKLQFEKTKK